MCGLPPCGFGSLGSPDAVLRAYMGHVCANSAGRGRVRVDRAQTRLSEPLKLCPRRTSAGNTRAMPMKLAARTPSHLLRRLLASSSSASPGRGHALVPLQHRRLVTTSGPSSSKKGLPITRATCCELAEQSLLCRTANIRISTVS